MSSSSRSMVRVAGLVGGTGGFGSFNRGVPPAFKSLWGRLRDGKGVVNCQARFKFQQYHIHNFVLYHSTTPHIPPHIGKIQEIEFSVILYPRQSSEHWKNWNIVSYCTRKLSWWATYMWWGEEDPCFFSDDQPSALYRHLCMTKEEETVLVSDLIGQCFVVVLETAGPQLSERLAGAPNHLYAKWLFSQMEASSWNDCQLLSWRQHSRLPMTSRVTRSSMLSHG